MPKFGFLKIALLALLVVIFQGTWALAGTTGGMSGTIVLNDGTPLAGAKVTVTSPSESVSTTTDATGHFGFVSLAPDTYTVVVSKDGYDSVSQAGVTVFADNVQTVSLSTQRTVKVIGTVPVHAAAELVKPGTTADVYSVNTTVQGKVTALGGGGAQDSAYSAIASVPGAYVPPGSAGWYQTVLIRGGDYDQVGYEYDGVPVNRSFDNYPSSGAGTLGQQELQVYTGSAPANAESQGLAGFINQVIKAGTYPGFANLDVGVGSPGLYNKLNVELGGATPNRNFSYYVGVGGYAYGQRYYDQHDGASLDPTWGTIFAQTACPNAGNINFANCYASGTGPGGYAFGPFVAVSTGTIQDRESVVNLHFGIPHHNDSGKDDIQLLYNTFYLRNPYQNSLNDWGVSTFANSGVPNPQFFGGGIYTGPLGQAVPNLCAAPCNIVPYQFPSSGVGPGVPGSSHFGPIPANQQDSSENGQGIGKIQYQHNIGSNAYFRLYAYSYYSWWYLHGPNSAWLAINDPNAAECCPGDYTLFTHTHGVSASFADQITPQHLLNFEISQISATSVRDNNSSFFNFATGSRARFAVRVDSTNPNNGICYDASNTATTCSTDIVAADFLRLNNVFKGGVTTDLTGQTCGLGPCEYLAFGSGDVATYNAVKPTFTAGSIKDSWKPTDRLSLDIGVRVDRYEFKGQDTTGPARAFWFNAYNQDNCVSTAPGSTPQDKTTLTKTGSPPGTFLSVTDQCSAANNAGATFVSPNLQNVSAPVFTYTDTQPRIGGTYTLDANNVIRFNYGKYSQAPNAAFEQYNTNEQNSPRFLGARFYKYGFTTPGHNVPPEDSYNSDISFEHHFANSDTSLKLTPFYRKTKGQYQTFFLDQATAFVSGLPAGNLTAEGIEFQLAKGDFNRNGLSAILSYAYTHAYINYYTLSNGGTVLSPVNNLIKQYNAYTSGCSGNTTNAACGGGLDSRGNASSPCYNPDGSPNRTCAAGSIANPYWNAPTQPLLDEFAKYADYSLIPNGFEQSVGSNDVPHVATLILNYKHDKWAFTPIIAVHSGNAYGAPLETSGIDPATCAALPSGSTANDPRYPYGAAGGSPYDALTCGTLAGGIPNPYTHVFDSLGAFRGPSQLQAHLGISYEATPRTTFSVNLVNLVNTCFGGTSEPWTNQPNVSKNRVCSYVLPAGIGINSVGNVYNPGAAFQQQVQYPYMPSFGAFSPNGGGTSQTFAATIEMKMKL